SRVHSPVTTPSLMSRYEMPSAFIKLWLPDACSNARKTPTNHSAIRRRGLATGWPESSRLAAVMLEPLESAPACARVPCDMPCSSLRLCTTLHILAEIKLILYMGSGNRTPDRRLGFGWEFAAVESS